MRKKFLTDFVFIQALNLLIKPVWILVIDRNVQNLLPNHEYGTYFSLTGFSLIFMIVLDLGLTNYNNREVSLNRDFYKANFWSIITSKTILSILFFALAFSLGYAIGFTKHDLLIFGLLAINQTILSFNTFLRSNISAIQKFKIDGILSVVDRFFVVLSLSAILWISFCPVKLSLYTFILTQTAGLLLTFILSWLATSHYLGKAEWTIDRQKIYALIKQALPFAYIIAWMTLFTRIDSVLILTLMPQGRLEASNYAMCYRLLDAAAIIGTLLAGQLLPLFAANLKDKLKIRSLIKWSSLGIFIPAILATLLCSLRSQSIMESLYPGHFTPAVGVIFSILIWCIPGMVLVNIFGTLLTAAGQIKKINQLAMITCAINIIGNLVFIKSYGLIGVAMTAVITQLFFGIACYRMAKY